jgi:type I restriction enzyme S subunit
MISSTRGFVSQADRYSRFMAGESLKNYVELHQGEFAYNKGNSKTYPQGCVFQLNGWERAAVPNVYISLSLEEESMHPDFASQFFAAGGLNRALKRVITSGARSNGLLNLSVEDFFDCGVPVPPLPEQKKIAAILSSVDKAIQATQAVIEQTRRVKEGLLQDLLTKGIGHTRFKQTEIGEIPEAWEVASLLEMAELQHGKAFPSTDYCTQGVRLVRPGNLHVDNVVVWDDAHTTCLPSHHWEESPDYQVGPNEILMNLTAQSLADNFLGRVCMTPAEGSCLLNQRIGRILPAPDVSRDFLVWALQGPQFREHLRTRGQGSKVQHLYNRDLETARLPHPPLAEQQSISNAMWEAREAVDASSTVEAWLHQVTAGLLQDLLTGKVRVSV